MKKDKIKIKIKDFFSKFIGGIELDDNEELFSSGLVNSLFAMQLVLFIEKELEIKVKNEDLDLNNFQTINAITDFVFKKKNI
ncbi:MAG TPA: phosphopantetheine-binding protein [Victivallales bacterium]|nr:phosphopantetheine-binding protein [Victivallales bacterium]